MNKKWKKRDGYNTSNGEGITSSNGSSDHTSSNQAIKRYVELGPCINKDLKDIATTIRSMDIEFLSVDPNPCGHQTTKQR